VLLSRTLDALGKQETIPGVSYSIVVADNDSQQSAKNTVEAFKASNIIKIKYCVEPEQNIALARNKAIENADGNYIAFIDDDELPAVNWLSTMLSTLTNYKADGVLGPVRPFFDINPPDWIIKGRFCDRPEHPTGLELNWRQTRTGNVLFRRDILDKLTIPFREQFGNGGEDQDFFKRLIETGHKFVWCNEAIVYEIVPPERLTRRYMLKRALLRGQNEKLHLNRRSLIKSMVAVPMYLLVLSVIWLRGEHEFMKFLIRLFDHIGKLLVATGIKPVKGKYLNG
jgi:glycosyltransferase involved in cell wall biosynthesis